MYRFRLLLAVLGCWMALACAALPLPASAQENDEDSPFRSGLVATYSAGDEATRTTATRIDEVVAFDWQVAAPDPRLPSGPFAANWRGKLWARSVGQHRLLCYVQGEVEIKLLGRVVITGNAAEPRWFTSEPIELEFGRHDLEIAYRRPGVAGQLALFWSGPDFRLEPIPARALLHDREGSPSGEFDRGQQLATARRCAACHIDSAANVIPAPALDRLTGNVTESWLIEWLSSHAAAGQSAPWRMPDLAMTREEVTAVAAWLLRKPPVKTEPKEQPRATDESKGTKSGKKKGEPEKPKPSAAEGEKLLLTRGCLACHQLGEFGERGLFGGGDLTSLFQKRPADFFVRWLDNPAAINRSHRMPVFSFTPDEVKSLALWANEQTEKAGSLAGAKQSMNRELIAQGEKLVGQFGCANCHLTESNRSELAAAKLASLTARSDWSRSCGRDADRAKMRPGYRLAEADQAALKVYYSQQRQGEANQSAQAAGHDLLLQLNCLACHQREGVKAVGTLRVPSLEDNGTLSVPATLQEKLAAVAEHHDNLAPLVPAMTPPALNSVGDKLHDTSLAESISRQGPPHRPYLLVQMPKFNLAKDQIDALVAYFTATDRIPRGAGVSPALRTRGDETPTPQLLAAGPRLVTTDGLACTSCHQIGSVPPAKAPINARGPNLSMAEKRIRREWFERFCADPARIVPRMEMPSVKVPIRGVLNEKIDDQLAAVWHILNTPGFEPPEPNPVRVLRLSGVNWKQTPVVIRDVIKNGDKTYLYPLVIGLPNRHNILFDLETNRLAAWWQGDTARQRTKGKSWYWEMGGKSILEGVAPGSQVSVWIKGKEHTHEAKELFASQLDSIYKSPARENRPPTASAAYRTAFVDRKNTDDSRSVIVVNTTEDFHPYHNEAGRTTGFSRVLQLSGDGKVDAVRFQLVNAETARTGKWNEATQTMVLPEESGVAIRIRNPSRVHWNNDGSVSITNDGRNIPPLLDAVTATPKWELSLVIDYTTTLSVDQYIAPTQPSIPIEPSGVLIAPGLAGQRLPLPDDIMPSAFSWNSNDLFFTSLKGQLYRAFDRNGDQLEDALQLIADGLATPYGLQTGRPHYVDVAAKDGLLRVHLDNELFAFYIKTAASGWGFTDDYHDWAVGPISGNEGDYYVALPCQQDQRSEAAAEYRGKILRLIPRKATPDNPQLFDIEVISSGHRFPMGMAMNRDGELFVTDNQGNYNPFNELNHVKKGAHFGFINALEKEQGFKPPQLDEPAIDIPHPWTRSVNGICFLDTPVANQGSKKGGPALAEASLSHPTGPTKSIFGPLEGHLVGCEYDTRRLIRMSLQKVGDSYQGAAYPLSIPTEDVEKGLLGPIVCAVKPTTGELYIGEIRDSGWGAGNNIGQIVKIKIEPEKLPCGIAEVRATSTSFTIDFFQPVDRAKAADPASYAISSYRRESTPAYGGPDLDRRSETIKSIAVDESGKHITLTLPELRTGHVYELKLNNLAPGGGTFHPDEAHYTLRKIPQ